MLLIPQPDAAPPQAMGGTEQQIVVHDLMALQEEVSPSVVHVESCPIQWSWQQSWLKYMVCVAEILLKRRPVEEKSSYLDHEQVQ
jgi:hypothetical protein